MHRGYKASFYLIKRWKYFKTVVSYVLVKKLLILSLGLLVISVFFVHCAFSMGGNSYCPFKIPLGDCSGHNVIQSAIHHVSSMLNSTLATLPLFVSFSFLFAFMIFLKFEDIFIYKPVYSLVKIEKPIFAPRKHIFRWLSIIRQRDPENSAWAYNIG